MILIIKKENYKDSTSIKIIKQYKFSFIAKIFKMYYQLKGYEVGELND